MDGDPRPRIPADPPAGGEGTGPGGAAAPSPVAVEPPPGSPPVPSVPAGRVSVALAWASLACFVVALVLLVIPVSTPEVQDCGAPGAYLAQGRLDVIPDANDQILGPDGEVVTLDGPVADAARDEPCQQRVAGRAVPAGVLLLVGTLGGLAAFVVEVLVVRPRRRRAWRAAVEASSPPGPPARPPSG